MFTVRVVLFMTDVISVVGIERFLSEDIRSEIKTEVFKTVDSTNKIVKDRASQGAREGLFAVAGEQTQGRGRLGRSFYSPTDTGLYMSLLLKPAIKAEDAVLITTAAAVSVCEALEKVGTENPQIKWVNDIFVNSKKVCGILTEASFNSKNGAFDYAVLGVGVNVYEPESGFPEEIKDIAGSVFAEEKENLRNRIAAEFLNSFMGYYKELSKKPHNSEYARRCFVTGKRIDVIKGDAVRTATALSVDENCGLLVEFSDGVREVLTSGEISVRVQD